jgi:hypothetical protein
MAWLNWRGRTFYVSEVDPEASRALGEALLVGICLPFILVLKAWDAIAEANRKRKRRQANAFRAERTRRFDLYAQQFMRRERKTMPTDEELIDELLAEGWADPDDLELMMRGLYGKQLDALVQAQAQGKSKKHLMNMADEFRKANKIKQQRESEEFMRKLGD